MLRICSILATLLFHGWAQGQEICNNGVDDDGNGLVDLNDPACSCSALLNPGSVSSYLPNHAFEQFDPNANCCPVSFGLGLGFYDPFWCLNGWNQTTFGSSDFMHPCGYYPAILPPSPDGGGYIGFISTPDYQEYVGRCLPVTTLQAGVEYTLSFRVLGTSLGIRHPGATTETIGVYYHDPLPLTIFGRPDCQWTATPTYGCLGVDDTWTTADGTTYVHEAWSVLGSMEYVAVGEWQHVSISFTPTFNVQRIAIGGGCDLPVGLSAHDVATGTDTIRYNPYFLVDELMLNVATAFETLPVTAQGDVCAGDLLLTASPPAGATDHQWYLEGVAIVGATSLQLDAAALGLGAGVYTFTCTTSGECLMGWTTVQGPDAWPSVTIGPQTGCVPLTVTFTEDRHPEGSMVNWWFGDGGTATGTTVQHTYTVPGIHDVRVMVSTPQGCVLDSTFIAAVIAHPLPQVSFHASPQPVHVGATEVTLEDLTPGTVANWHWDLDTVPPFQHDEPFVRVLLPNVAGEYPVTLTITDGHGCVGVASGMLIVLDDSMPDMPNVFSPNGDGTNDIFIPLGEWTGAGELHIRNRWGQLVHSCSPPSIGWDGRVNGKPAPDGTYYYEIIVHGHSGTSTHTGYFHLLR